MATDGKHDTHFSGVRESLKPGNDKPTVDVDDVEHELEIPHLFPFTSMKSPSLTVSKMIIITNSTR